MGDRIKITGPAVEDILRDEGLVAEYETFTVFRHASREKRVRIVTTCVLRPCQPSYVRPSVLARGAAICAPLDVFDNEMGRHIARGRAVADYLRRTYKSRRLRRQADGRIAP